MQRLRRGQPCKRTSRSVWALALMAVFLCLVCDGLASSVLDFPRLSNQSGSITGIAIVNAGSSDAEIDFTAYGMDGQVLATAQAEVASGGRLGTVTNALFGPLDPDVVGWFQAVSSSSDLTGFFLFLNSDPSELDGADLPLRDRDIVFNQVRVGGGLSTELNLVNPGEGGLTVTLTLVGPPSPVEREVVLAGLGAARLDAATLFGVDSVPDGAYVLASAPNDILGFEFIRQDGADLQGLNSRSAEEFLNTLYFPQVAVLGPFVSELGLINYSNQAVLATATIHKEDGSLFVDELQQNPVTIPLAPGQSVIQDVETLFGFEGTEIAEGWLEVVSNTEAVNGQITYQTDGGAAAAVSVVAQGNKASIFSHVATTSGFFTGVAILNAGALPANLRVAVYDPDNALVGSFSSVLNPGNRISSLITDLVPEAADLGGGIVWMTSDVPLFPSSLFGSVSGDVLANVPAQEVPADFEPTDIPPRVKITPPLAVLTPLAQQTFTVEGLSGAVQWLVNGLQGGGGNFGSISQAGTYTAPPLIDPSLPVLVTAVSSGQSGAAAVDVITEETLFSDLGIVQSVAYLTGLQRLFSAELNAGGFFQPGRRRAPKGSSESTIYDISPPLRDEILSLDDDIADMIDYVATNDQEFLLLAGRATGSIIRLDPVSGAFVVVATGLDAPSALAFDRFSATLLVAEATQISTIPQSSLEVGIGPASVQAVDGNSRVLASELVPNDGVGGIAVDDCAGDIFFSVPSLGQVLKFARADGQISVAVDGLSQPTSILFVYRDGVSCPDSSHLLIAESDQISLYVPATGQLISPWLETSTPPVDLVFIPPGSPLGEGGFLLVGGVLPDGETGVIASVPISGLYETKPINPPLTTTDSGGTTAPGPDFSITAATGQLSGNATVSIGFEPGVSPGGESGPGNIGAIVLSIDYDETKLIFDPSDGNDDGIPDAIISSLPAGYELTVLTDLADGDGELDIIIVDLQASAGGLPGGNLFSITFQTLPDAIGTATVAFSEAPEISIADLLGAAHGLDEVSNGKVSVFPTSGPPPAAEKRE